MRMNFWLIACMLKTSPPNTVLHVFFKEKVELPQPASKEDVRRLMGTVASFKDFIPDTSKAMFPIRQPLKRGVDF